ncbi:MAG: hypothetical protein N2324_12865, partial [Thermus sp.]|nr:hypothetical protein [Thermus sp.]
MGKTNLNLRAWQFLQGEGYTLIPNRLMLAILTAGVDRKLGRSAQVVLFALASRRNLRHREASPEDLHALTGIGLRTLRKVLAELWELGLVDKGAYGYALSSGAEALGEELPQAQERKALPAGKTLPERRKNLPRSRDESSVQKGVRATARNKGEVKEVKEKNPLHPHAHGQSPRTEEEGSTQRKGQG